MNFRPLANPILLISDSPELLTGLARMGRDLATLLCSMAEFRVGYLGMAGYGSSRFPWAQYHFPQNGQWGSDYLSRIWQDFAGSEPGIVLSLWDLSRMLWFTQSGGMPAETQKFLGPGRTFLKWGYVPVDASGPDEHNLPIGQAAAATGYDRLATASEWGANILRPTRSDVTWMPHGLWMDKFRPVPDARKLLGWAGDSIVIGCCMTNQARKDWPVAFEAISLLKREYGNRFKAWLHVDALVNYWNLYALAADYNVGDALDITLELTDDQLALRYSGCDATMVPSGGEGFCYPVAESMACGVPCVTTDYAAAAELVEPDCRVYPVGYRIDTIHNVRRAVLSGFGFARALKIQIERAREDREGVREAMTKRVEHLSWKNLSFIWKRWLLEELK